MHHLQVWQANLHEDTSARLWIVKKLSQEAGYEKEGFRLKTSPRQTSKENLATSEINITSCFESRFEGLIYTGNVRLYVKNVSDTPWWSVQRQSNLLFCRRTDNLGRSLNNFLDDNTDILCTQENTNSYCLEPFRNLCIYFNSKSLNKWISEYNLRKTKTMLPCWRLFEMKYHSTICQRCLFSRISI